jgi:hypothetical protein
MVFMHEETVVSLNDLQFVCIECPDCRTRVILDMEQQFVVAGRTVFSPEVCPGCRKAFDSAIPGNLDTLQRVYSAIPRALRSAITFHKRAVPETV